MKRTLLAILLSGLFITEIRADDWPQFRGSDRSGVSKEKGLLKAWPKDGPPLAWTFKDAGLGFSSVAVAKGVVYTLGTDKAFTDEYIIALDEKSGKELWTAKIGPLYQDLYKDKDGKIKNANSYGDGPRATPTVDGTLLFALGGQGQLICVDVAQKGKELWRTHLVNDLGGVLMDRYGWSEAPLVDGDYLICTPGGPKGTLAKLDKKTGKVVWRSVGLTHSAPFAAAVAAELHGVRQYIQTGYVRSAGKEYGAISGIDAKTGNVLWSETIFKGANDGIGSTPIVSGNLVYISTGFGGGCHLFEIDAKQNATDLYSKAIAKKVKNTHGGLVLVNGHLFGHTEKTSWICQEFKTGEIAWTERDQLTCTSGSIAAADGLLYLYTDDGVAALVEPDTMSFKLISSFKIPMVSKIPQTRVSSRAAQIWAHPVIANGHLYLRDHEYIFAFKIAK
jgi:outer membrane protein assembly factor BamB